MIAHCLLCESLVRFYSTPAGIEAKCSECYSPELEPYLRGFGIDERDAAEDLYRVQEQELEDNAKALVANLFTELEVQMLDEAHRQRRDRVMFEVGPFKEVPRKALELAKWAAQGK